MKQQEDPSGWHGELRDLMRAIAAGAIFGTPLLFTTEMWWHGIVFRAPHLLILLTATLLANVVICYFIGFREQYSLKEAANEAVTSVAVAILLSTGVLALIGELNLESSLFETLGKIIIESSVISVGVAVTNAQVSQSKGHQQNEDNHKESDKKQLKQDIKDLGATLAGSTIFAFNVAPTEEVVMIAARLTPLHQLVLLGAEIALCFIMLFASGFWKRQVHAPSIFQSAFAETTMACAMSLLVAASLVALVGHGNPMSHTSLFVSCTIVLGFPAVVGGAAGRLII